MGSIHTKRRVWLTYDKVFDTAVVRMDLKRKHAADGLTHARLKRQFGSPALDTVLAKCAETPGYQHDDTAKEMAEIDMLGEDEASLDIIALATQLGQEVLDDEDLPDDETQSNDTPAPLSRTNQRVEPLPKRVQLFFGTQEPILQKELFD